MHLIILGSGTGLPISDRASPSLVLTSSRRPILFDIGPGTLRELSRVGIPFHRIAMIFVTHFHPDHTADLVHLFFATRNPSILEEREPFTEGNGYRHLEAIRGAAASGEVGFTFHLRDVPGEFILQCSMPEAFEIYTGLCPDMPADKKMSFVMLRLVSQKAAWQNRMMVRPAE